MKILVTGGAGYIGSITAAELLKEGFEVVVFDNLSEGHREAVSCPIIVGDLVNKKSLEKVFGRGEFEAVIHFANKALAPESMEKPYEYFRNNVLGGLNLLEIMNDSKVDKIIFSSSCAVYGYPEKLPVDEKSPLSPVSVYGETKVMFEKMLLWYEKIYGTKYISLRYFNAAGATLDGKWGEDHERETHIIPIALQVAMGLRKRFILFGDDYRTKDGTCIRDYIHVVDLARAHILALKYLLKEGKSEIFNLGAGRGYSNKEVLEMVKKVTGRGFEVKLGKRRLGDPDAIYADNKKIKKVLGFEPKYSDLGTIVKTAWSWHKAHPKGYFL